MKKKTSKLSWFGTGAFAIIGVVYIMPILIVLINSFKNKVFINKEPFKLPTKQTWVGIDNFLSAIDKYELLGAVGWTVFITVGSVLVILVCKKIQVRQTLKEIAEQIDMGEFLFVNKSCIVQKRMILSVDKKNRRVNLTGGYQVEVAVREMKKVCIEAERLGIRNAVHI